jgi:hypothetical protein
VGNRPDNLVPGILERFRNQIKQKKIPTRYGGKWQTESIYNPQSMNEDFYFAVRPNGNTSKVETLPSGANLGELSELDYFYRKMWRALRIPSSYMGTSTEDGDAIENESKVGVAYMQEIKFAQYIQRLQRYVEEVMDIEFKRWVYDSEIRIDPTIYRITLPEPSDYYQSRQQLMDADMLNNFGTVDAIPYFSKRFIMERYAGLSKDEIRQNEEMVRIEKGLSILGDDRDLALIYQPEDAEAGGFDGGVRGGGGGSSGGAVGGGEGEEGTEEETGGEGGAAGAEGEESPEGEEGTEEGAEEGMTGEEEELPNQTKEEPAPRRSRRR